MSNDVALSAAIRSNLNSLQSTNNLLNTTTERLATGREVNSVFDDPINFVASQNLNDQAGDLSRLLDGIGQNIRSIEQAVNGTNAIEGLLDQAQAITNSAREAIAGGGSQARVTGNVDISGIEDFVDEDGVQNTGTTFSRIEFVLTDPADSDNPVLDANDGSNTTLQQAAQIDFGGGNSDFTGPISADELVNAINDINDQLRSENQITEDVIRARLDENGQLEVTALNGGDFELNFLSASNDAENDANNLNFVQTLGLSNVAGLQGDGGTTSNDVIVSSVGSPTLASTSLFVDDPDNPGTARVAQASDALADLFSADTLATGTAGDTERVFFNNDGSTIDAADSLEISVNGGSTTASLTLDGSIQDLVDEINNTSGVGNQIQASFDSETGQINIRSISADVETVDFTLTDDAGGTVGANSALSLGVSNRLQATTDTTDDGRITESVRLAASAGELVELEQQFNDTRTQIDQLVSDAGFRGINLLNGDVLETVFNASRTSTIETEGAIFTSSGLGLEAANFTSVTNIDQFDSDVRGATLEVRNFSANLTNDLNVISTRESFTNDTINTLQAASDDLTLANQEEESARLLALQTRQSLGITSLSLANQAQQGILRLF